MSSGKREPMGLYPGGGRPMLYDRLVEVMRAKHYSFRTQKAYVHWIGRYLRFHDYVHPRLLDAQDVNQFLSDLAARGRVAASTQNQALAGILFLYKHVLGSPMDTVETVLRARRPLRAPVVLTREEVCEVLAQMAGVSALVASLIYGSGARLMEALTIRLKDVDLSSGQLLVRDGKGAKDRTTTLPATLTSSLEGQFATVLRQHRSDLARGLGRVALPGALSRKYPNASSEPGWQWLFPASSHYVDSATGVYQRHHLHETVVQKAVAAAASRTGILKHVTPHTLRHSFATHLLQDSYDIRTVQELLGHESVKTTQIYTHVLNRGGLGVRSPLDTLAAGGLPAAGGLLSRHPGGITNPGSRAHKAILAGERG